MVVCWSVSLGNRMTTGSGCLTVSRLDSGSPMTWNGWIENVKLFEALPLDVSWRVGEAYWFWNELDALNFQKQTPYSAWDNCGQNKLLFWKCWRGDGCVLLEYDTSESVLQSWRLNASHWIILLIIVLVWEVAGHVHMLSRTRAAVQTQFKSILLLAHALS